MKHISYILVFFLFSFTKNVNTQALYPFPQPGLEQVNVYHADYTTGFAIYNWSFKYIDDTVVGLDTFARLQFAEDAIGDFRYTYYDSGKVYYHVTYSTLGSPLSGNLLYDFSLNMGDSIYLNNYWGMYCHVDSIGSVLLLNGQTRKYIHFTEGIEWIDAIGDINQGFFYTQPGICGGNEELICQKDSSGIVYTNPTSTLDCDYASPVYEEGPITCGGYSYTLSINPPTCPEVCNGNISVSGVSGGVSPPYLYSISGGPSSSFPSFGSICEGAYSFTISDMTGISCTISFFVEASSLNSVATITPTSCNGSCDASVCVIASGGGGGPYGCYWNTGGWGFCQSSLCPGSYDYCVYDGTGCEICSTVVITEPDTLSLTINTISASCPTCCDGDLQIIPNGGTPPYTTSYTLGISASPNNFCAGNYVVCVTDSNGCQICDSAAVNYLLGNNNLENENGITIFPNPFNNYFTIQSTTNESKSVNVFTADGKIIFSNKFANETEIRVSSSKWDKGIYLVRIANESGSSVHKIVKE